MAIQEDAEKEEVQEKEPEAEAEPEVVEEPEVVDTEPEEDPERKRLKSIFKEDDPRKAIYARSDAKRFPEPVVEEQPEEIPEPAESAEEKPPEKGADKVDVKFTAEEVYEHFKGIPVKTKIDGKEVELDLTEIVRTGLKSQGLESKLTREAMELSQRERQLNEAERQIAQRFESAKKAPEKPAEYTGKERLRDLSEDQVQEQYDSLMAESPYRAQKFIDSVKADRERAQQESVATRVDNDTREFLSTYEDVSKDDWIYMNNPAFYEKYPDIIRAMSRASSNNDYYPVFVAARARLIEEKLSAKQADVSAKEEKKQAEIRKRMEAKKKGSVLRVNTRVQPQEKKEEGYQPESRTDFVKRRIHEARVRQGLEPPPKK